MALVVVCMSVGRGRFVQADEAPSAVGPLMKLYQSNRLPAERLPPVVEMICNRGNERDLRVVFDRLLQGDAMPAPLRLKVMGWLADAATTRKVKPEGDLSGLATLLKADDKAVQLAAIRLAAIYQIAAAAPTLQKIAADAESPADLQRAAVSGLVLLGGDASRETLLRLATEARSIPLRMHVAAGLAGIELPIAARHAAKVFESATPQDDPAELLNAFFDRKGGSDLLADELRKSKLSVDVAKRALRHMYSIGRSDAALSAVLSEAAGVAADPPPPTQEEVAQLVREVIEKGDPDRGEKVFRRGDVSCFRCHSLNRAGGQVGPDLSAIGGSSPLDYVVNSILNPSLAVKEQYVTRVFETSEGKVLTGIVVDRDESRVRIRDSQGQVIVLPTESIDDEAEGKSMMPNGITKFLTKDELLDLIRFVSELGKPGPYAVRGLTAIQRWQVLIQPPAELTAEVPHLEHIRQHVLGSPPEAWSPIYGKISGALPLDELRKANQPNVVILRGELQVSEPGRVAVRVTSTEPCQVWVDSTAFGIQKEFEVTLEPGRHPVILRVELSAHDAPELRVEFSRPEGSTAQFEVVGGS